jgi:HK97 gp10 family phage protein
MKLKIKTRVKIDTQKTRVALERALAPAMERAADYMVGVTKIMISTPYPPSSTPGDPPHMRTGDLMRSIQQNKRGRTYVISAGTDGGTASYASYLEYGTSKMAPRPFMRPMIGMIINRLTHLFKGAF